MTASTAGGTAASRGHVHSLVLSVEDLLGAADPTLTLDALGSIARWVYWKAEARNDKQTKVPYQPARPGARASSTRPDTWGTRGQAEAANAGVGGSGIGLMLGTCSGLTIGGVDLDSCRAASGEIADDAREVIGRFSSYSEVSPSGTGVKIFFAYDPDEVAGKLPDHKARISFNRGDHCEMALDLRDRYYAVTNQVLPGCTTEIRPVSGETLQWFTEVAGPAFKSRGQSKVDRSAVAYGFACEVKRGGGGFEEFERRLAADPVIAEWAKDKRQVKRTWDRADVQTPEEMFDDVEGFETDDSPLAKFPLTEDGVALAFAHRNARRLRYCHSTAAWYEWKEFYWRRDETQIGFSWARRECREAGRRNPEAKALSKAAAAAAVERFAKADRRFAVTVDFWDRNPWLLGTPGGVVDLRTGEVVPPDPLLGITKLTLVAPDFFATCPLWLQFLHDATAGDSDLIRFLQQWCGYTLSGDIREHALLFIYGPGGNGKSVFLNTVTRILGDYVRTAGMDVFTASKNDRHSTELARLRGARMVCASETEEGRAWAEVRIKQLTGGDVITARFMRQDDFEFRPEFKLTVVGNHKPLLRNVDAAARRRFNVVPFEHNPTNPDRELEAKLRPEFPAILAWMIAGCIDWQANGLCRPSVVEEATQDYFSDQDVFGQWLEDCCEAEPRYAALSSDLFHSYQLYAQNRGEGLYGKSRGFPDALKSRGFRPIKDSMGIRGRGFAGIRLRNVFDEALGE
jgi:putative DNA primase/helicase